LVRARFKLDFEVQAHFKIGKEMEVTLPDGSRIVFDKSNGVNRGRIFFEIDQPNESIATSEGQLRVEQFFNCMLITWDRFNNVRPISFPVKAEWQNLEDFEEVPKTSYVDRSSSFSIASVEVEQQTLKAVIETLAKINGLSQEKQDIILRSLRWFRKASEVYGEDRFVFHWISFEALLGLLKKRRPTPTQNLIPEFVDGLKAEAARRAFDRHQPIVKELSEANLVGWWRDARYSEELQKELSKRRIHPRAILPKAALCIYEVRNRLFHKGEALAIMEGSSSLLRDIIRECLKFRLKS